MSQHVVEVVVTTPQKTLAWRMERQLQLEEAEDQGSSISYLAAGHFLHWCDWLESAAKLRFHMHNTIKDPMSHPMITRLSQMLGNAR